MFQAYIFDLEGTLGHFGWASVQGVKAAKLKLEQMGFDEEKLLKVERVNEVINEALRYALLGRVDVPAYEVKRGIGEVYDFFDSDALARGKPREDMKEVLTELHSRATIGLFTTFGWKASKKALEKFEIDKLFHILITRDDVTLAKPHGEGLILILRCLAISGEEAIYIGDTSMDILAARDAGVKSGFIAGGKQELADLAAEPDYIFHSFPDILAVK
jgi:phosphoglycolate phosphatase-like HAD superfamily hydrolase